MSKAELLKTVKLSRKSFSEWSSGRVSTLTYVHSNTYIHTYILANTYIHSQTDAHTHTFTYTLTHTLTHSPIHTLTHTDTHICAHPHTLTSKTGFRTHLLGCHSPTRLPQRHWDPPVLYHAPRGMGGGKYINLNNKIQISLENQNFKIKRVMSIQNFALETKIVIFLCLAPKCSKDTKFGKCTWLHCRCFQVQSGSELIGSYLWVKYISLTFKLHLWKTDLFEIDLFLHLIVHKKKKNSVLLN